MEGRQEKKKENIERKGTYKGKLKEKGNRVFAAKKRGI